jgi:hypothetical protein
MLGAGCAVGDNASGIRPRNRRPSVSKGASDTNLTKARAGVSRAAELRIRLKCRRPFGGECTSAFVLPHGARCLPGRRGSDTRTEWPPLVPAKGMVGRPDSLPTPCRRGDSLHVSQRRIDRAGLAVKSTRGKSGLGRACSKRPSALSVRGHAVGRWPRFKPWQGGYCPAGRAGALEAAAPAGEDLQAISGPRRARRSPHRSPKKSWPKRRSAVPGGRRRCLPTNWACGWCGYWSATGSGGTRRNWPTSPATYGSLPML